MKKRRFYHTAIPNRRRGLASPFWFSCFVSLFCLRETRRNRAHPHYYLLAASTAASRSSAFFAACLSIFSFRALLTRAPRAIRLSRMAAFCAACSTRRRIARSTCCCLSWPSASNRLTQRVKQKGSATGCVCKPPGAEEVLSDVGGGHLLCELVRWECLAPRAPRHSDMFVPRRISFQKGNCVVLASTVL